MGEHSIQCNQKSDQNLYQEPRNKKIKNQGAQQQQITTTLLRPASEGDIKVTRLNLQEHIQEKKTIKKFSRSTTL